MAKLGLAEWTLAAAGIIGVTSGLYVLSASVIFANRTGHGGGLFEAAFWLGGLAAILLIGSAGAWLTRFWRDRA